MFTILKISRYPVHLHNPLNRAFENNKNKLIFCTRTESTLFWFSMKWRYLFATRITLRKLQTFCHSVCFVHLFVHLQSSTIKSFKTLKLADFKKQPGQNLTTFFHSWFNSANFLLYSCIYFSFTVCLYCSYACAFSKPFNRSFYKTKNTHFCVIVRTVLNNTFLVLDEMALPFCHSHHPTKAPNFCHSVYFVHLFVHLRNSTVK